MQTQRDKLELQVPDGADELIIHWSRENQHIIRWEEDFKVTFESGEVGFIDAGSCNLYAFPKVLLRHRPTKGLTQRGSTAGGMLSELAPI